MWCMGVLAGCTVSKTPDSNFIAPEPQGGHKKMVDKIEVEPLRLGTAIKGLALIYGPTVVL